MTSIQALSNAQGYAIYLEQEGVGEWLGSGSKVLGLAGEVSQQEYRAVCRGEDPKTHEYLLPLPRVERLDHKRTERLRELEKIAPDQEMMFQSREAYSLVLSSPKTVSIQSMVDPRMIECHERAVAVIIPELERRSGGKLVIAAYQHRTSRAGDPLLHTHLVIANLQETEKGWRSVRAIHWYTQKAELTERFEGEVLRQAERLGYSVKEGHLEGVSDELFRKFSQRSGEREDAIERFKQEQGLDSEAQLSDRRIASLVYRNRPDKVSLPPEQMRLVQLSRLTAAELGQLHDMKEQALERQQEQMRQSPVQYHVDSEAPLRLDHWSYGESVECGRARQRERAKAG